MGGLINQLNWQLRGRFHISNLTADPRATGAPLFSLRRRFSCRICPPGGLSPAPHVLQAWQRVGGVSRLSWEPSRMRFGCMRGRASHMCGFFVYMVSAGCLQLGQEAVGLGRNRGGRCWVLEARWRGSEGGELKSFKANMGPCTPPNFSRIRLRIFWLLWC